MTSFFFGRQPTTSKTHNGVGATPPASGGAVPDPVRGAIEAQSITASAIFAMLVSKGVLSAGEAGEYMREIGEALRRDVAGSAGEIAGRTLDAYGAALAAADG